MPIIGALCCAYLVGPWTGRDPRQYTIAGILLGVGVVLWLITFFINRAMCGHDRPTSRTPRRWRASETKPKPVSEAAL